MSARVRDAAFGPRDSFVSWLHQNKDATSLPDGTLPMALMTHALQPAENQTDPLLGERMRSDWMLPLLSQWLPSFVTRRVRVAAFRLMLGLSLDCLLGTSVAVQLIAGLKPCDDDVLWSVLHGATSFCRMANAPGQPCSAQEWSCCTNIKSFTPLLVAVQATNRTAVHVVRKQMLDHDGTTSVRLYQLAAVIRNLTHVTPQGWDNGVFIAVAFAQIDWLRHHTACGGVICNFAFTLGVGCVRAIVVSCQCGALCAQPPPEDRHPRALTAMLESDRYEDPDDTGPCDAEWLKRYCIRGWGDAIR